MEHEERVFPVTPIIPESGEVIARFDGLLADADMKREFDILKIGRLHWRRRKKAAGELRALYTSLWKLALNKSFPSDAERFFDAYLEKMATDPSRKPPEREGQIALVREYVAVAQENGEADFTPLARRLVKALVKKTEGLRELEVRFILLIRSAYRLIFDKMI